MDVRYFRKKRSIFVRTEWAFYVLLKEITGKGASIYDVRKIFRFFYPLPPVRKFTQPPILRLLTMSAFEGTPLPPQCDCHNWKPPKVVSLVRSTFIGQHRGFYIRDAL